MAHIATHGAGARHHAGQDEYETRRYDRDYDGRRTEINARERYGGLNIGSSFFGWIVASGLTLLLTSLFVALGLTAAFSGANPAITGETARNAGIASGIALLVAMAIGYYAGGYVAGRMSRFDGARQGAGVFAFGLLAMIILGILGAVVGTQFNEALQNFNLPSITNLGNLTSAGLISSLIALAVMLVSAVVGGKVGERYHHKVDRVAYTE